MSVSHFRHVKVAGLATSLPKAFIDVDDELQYFGGNPKKLARQKKMIGYGRRYVADELTTVTDLACDAAKKLLAEMSIRKEDVDSLLFVNQTPDYNGPSDACIAHGVLGLRKDIPAMSIALGCSGYVYGLWTAHSMIESGAVRNCLLLAGDLPTRGTRTENRKSAPVFGDAASATWIVKSDVPCESSFVLGTDGTGYGILGKPFGGLRLPFDEKALGLSLTDEGGNVWTAEQSVMAGEEVFAFTMDVAPTLIRDVMKAAGWTTDDLSLCAIHQANKQILEMIVSRSGIPAEKVPTDVFSKYANNSTNSVVTVLCDQQGKPFGRTLLCTFGVGLSWAGAALDLTGAYNGGVSTYNPPETRPSKDELLARWVRLFQG